jgi:hypothetical protein
MFRKLTKSACLLLGLAAAQHAGAFTLWGPLETWQTADLDYGLRYYYTTVELLTGLGTTENGGPKNFGEGSRLTTPIITYGFDATFLDYFGSQGVAAVDSAMQVFNSLPSASSANLENFLTEGNEQMNYTAQALDMLDLKSTVMWLVAEHIGLLGETHVYDLLLRNLVPNPTVPCEYDYFVINRNYDPITYQPSTYVNGRLYTYEIWDGCPIGVNVGDAIEFPADSAASSSFTAVATPEGLELGGYYLGMTRDDVGGLQHLYKKNNYVFQGLDSNSVASPFLSSWEAVNSTNANTGISNFSGVLGGVEKITFVKVAYNSLLSTNFTPIIYNYSIPYVTNSKLGQLKVTRTVTAPDILFTAADLVNSEALPNDEALARTNSFIVSTYVSPGGGILPSTINPPLLIILNNVGPVYWNINPGFMDWQDYYDYPVFNWGTFDGSTNPPILYPNGSSLAELEQEVISGTGVNVQVSPWAPVAPPTNNTTTGGGGGAGGGTSASVPAVVP